MDLGMVSMGDAIQISRGGRAFPGTAASCVFFPLWFAWSLLSVGPARTLRPAPGGVLRFPRHGKDTGSRVWQNFSESPRFVRQARTAGGVRHPHTAAPPRRFPWRVSWSHQLPGWSPRKDVFSESKARFSCL